MMFKKVIYCKFQEPGFTKLLTSEEYSKELSVRMEQMTIHFLQQHHVLFTDKYIERRALAHLLKRSIRQVNVNKIKHTN